MSKKELQEKKSIVILIFLSCGVVNKGRRGLLHIGSRL